MWCLVGLVGCVGPAQAGQLLNATFDAQDYPGSRDRQYQLYIPDRYDGTVPVPLLMVLHGCNQTQRNMVEETGFNALAEQHNFIVVYPFITSYTGLRNANCWGFWFESEIHEGGGEAEDLHQLARSVEANYRVDPNRRYVTGLSSGGAMAVVLAVAFNEYFAAAGAAAGLPYSETSASVGFNCFNAGTFKSVAEVVAAIQAEQSGTDEQRPIPLMTIHSNNDCTVNRQASVNLRDAWRQRYGADATAYENSDCDAEGVRCRHDKYGAAGRSVVETVFYEGASGDLLGSGSHYWVGDNAGEYANPQGPSASALFWAFFQRHPFSNRQPPAVSITAASAEGRSIAVSGTATDPDGQVVSVRVRLEGRFPQSEQTASGTTTWATTFDDLPDNAVYTPVVTAIDDDGISTSISGELLTLGTPPNQAPTVMIDAVTVTGACVTVVGRAADADGTVTHVAVALGERDFEPAALEDDRYRYQACELDAGRYTTQASVTDNGGLVTTVRGPEVSVVAVATAEGNWQAHLNAGRLRVHSAPCQSGFGACDVDFVTLFNRFGFMSFVLYQDPATENWYLDPDKLPR